MYVGRKPWDATWNCFMKTCWDLHHSQSRCAERVEKRTPCASEGEDWPHCKYISNVIRGANKHTLRASSVSSIPQMSLHHSAIVGKEHIMLGGLPTLSIAYLSYSISLTFSLYIRKRATLIEVSWFFLHNSLWEFGTRSEADSHPRDCYHSNIFGFHTHLLPICRVHSTKHHIGARFMCAGNQKFGGEDVRGTYMKLCPLLI